MATVVKRRNRWVLDFYDNSGKRVWKTLPKGCTKAKGKEILRGIEDQLLKGIYLPDKKIPLFKDVAADWLEQRKQNVRESTLAMYQGHLNNHFDQVNDLPVNRITIATVEKYISAKQRDKVNITTLRKLIVTFNQVMKYSVRHRYIDHNPVADAERPKTKGGIEEKKLTILSIEQVNSFLNAVKEEKYKMLFSIAIMCGARQGEILGLKWSDIDWDKSQIHIQRTYNNRKWYKPKSNSSDRKIDVGPIIIAQLKKWRIACPPNDFDLIFPNDKGLPIVHTSMLRKHFWPALQKAEIPQIRFHDLRHTYASLLIERGENIKYIQSQLGHADPNVTLKVYAHLMNDVNQEAAIGLENMVFN